MSHERPIMLVDDDPSLLEALPQLLQRRLPHVPIEVVSSASAALAQLAMRRYGVIMSDVRMPVMDGWQLFDRLKQDERLARIPVVIITAFGRELGSVGQLPVLKKPIDLRDLHRAVERGARAQA